MQAVHIKTCRDQFVVLVLILPCYLTPWSTKSRDTWLDCGQNCLQLEVFFGPTRGHNYLQFRCSDSVWVALNFRQAYKIINIYIYYTECLNIYIYICTVYIYIHAHIIYVYMICIYNICIYIYTFHDQTRRHFDSPKTGPRYPTARGTSIAWEVVAVVTWRWRSFQGDPWRPEPIGLFLHIQDCG